MSHEKYAYFNILHKGALKIHFAKQRLENKSVLKRHMFCDTNNSETALGFLYVGVTN